MTGPGRADIVEAARVSIVKGSKSFAAASRLFDPVTREKAWMLYAWCRRCDDIADGQDHGHALSVVADPEAAVERMRAMTVAALAGETPDETGGEPAFDALRIVAAETGMPTRWPIDLIDGFRLDAEDWRPRSEADLYRYCYHVAGVVGCMMAVVMGVDADDADTLDRACDLGMAFQLANIMRDIEEDDRIGRCYLPEEWLVEMDIPPGQHMKPPFRSRLTVLTRRMAVRAAAFETSARAGTPRLAPRSAWAVLAAADIYGGIAREVALRGDHAWDRRVTTSRTQKIAAIARAGICAARRASLYPVTTPRPEWTRPGR